MVVRSSPPRLPDDESTWFGRIRDRLAKVRRFVRWFGLRRGCASTIVRGILWIAGVNLAINTLPAAAFWLVPLIATAFLLRLASMFRFWELWSDRAVEFVDQQTAGIIGTMGILTAIMMVALSTISRTAVSDVLSVLEEEGRVVSVVVLPLLGVLWTLVLAVYTALASLVCTALPPSLPRLRSGIASLVLFSVLVVPLLVLLVVQYVPWLPPH